MLEVKVTGIYYGGVKKETRYITFEELAVLDGMVPENKGMQLLEESVFIYKYTSEPIELYEEEMQNKKYRK